ncbi:MAG TPA: rhodanese-like domain-containing protein [Bauldia sp.]|jgi:rhodanese-related sulfurtransferase
MSGSHAGAYAGDIDVRTAWADLANKAEATLIDVRTKAEWSYVGVPVLASIGKATVFVEWDDFATGALVPDFIGRLKAELARHGVREDAPLYFICRSGNRSRQAAVAATAAGYSQAFNVAHGFEGRLDGERHRATGDSWKGEGLPWVQS